MGLFFFMLPFMLIFGVWLLSLFVWAVRSEQFEDLESEKHRIFFEER